MTRRLTAASAAALACAAPTLAQRARQADSARDCAVCHLSWVDSFKRAGAATLIPPPADSIVADQEVCLGCHDGSVADSRRKVWLQHGHQTGVAPPPGMEVSPGLPLEGGKLSCRTCHSAHSGQEPETLANAVFIRVPNDSGQLCQMCHPQQAAGPHRGEHPLGIAAQSVPDALLAAGARTGPSPQHVTCQTCHAAHGSAGEKLLVKGREGGVLCLECHAEMRPGMFLADHGLTSPRQPPLTFESRIRAISEMGTLAGEDQTLVCSSCHPMHGAKTDRFLLADRLEGGQLCLRCHSDYAGVLASTHHLVRTAPEERNRFGQTPDQSGPCMACHGFHRYSREPAPRLEDPSGLCATCHAPGQCAEKATGLPLSHPIQPDGTTIGCLACHNPHETRHANYLRTSADRLCADCHRDAADAFGAAHDLRNRPELRNSRGRSAAETGACGFCHAVHNAVGPAMWIATPQPPRSADGLCTECHRADGLANARVPDLRHPSGPAGEVRPASSTVPLFDAIGRRSDEGSVACATCHDPHGARQSMLRAPEPGRAASLCTECHREAEPIPASMHSAGELGRLAHATAASPIEDCRGCHRSHAAEGMAAAGMWTAPLGPASDPPEMRQCTGCHREGGGATPIVPRRHPAVALQNPVPSGAPGYMPLASEPDRPHAEGGITCVTCHLPHGRDFPDSGRATRIDLLRARMPMIRPYVTPNLCSTCHGFDGLRRFLYYHRQAEALSADVARSGGGDWN